MVHLTVECYLTDQILGRRCDGNVGKMVLFVRARLGRELCIGTSKLLTAISGTTGRSREHRTQRWLSTADTSLRNGPLTGVKVLDISRVLAAPMCAQILADYGAEVIKIEDVAKGDDTRHFRAKGEKKAWKPGIGPMSYYYASINRNKRSICLDLKQDEGREIFLELVKSSDVVVENFRHGTMEKLKIGYDVLSKVNPRIILGSVTGYGASGPDAKRAGYDMIVGAAAGLLGLTGERNGPPVRPGLGLTDMSTGLFLHGAVIAALYARDRTGRGQKIDTSLFESQVALLINVGMSWLNLGVEGERWGTQHPSVVPYDAFKTKDLHFVCGATNEKQWNIFCRLLEIEYLLEDERFKTNSDRVEHRDVLFPILNGRFMTKTSDEWDHAFHGSGMPYGPINNMQRVFAHAQTSARDMVQNIALPSAESGDLTIIGPPVKFSETHPSVRRAPALLGEHSAEILRELGRSDTDIEDLKARKVI